MRGRDLLAAALLAAASSGTAAAEAGAQATAVTATAGNAFTPSAVTVTAGSTVTWTNVGGGLHNVAFTSGPAWTMPSSPSTSGWSVARTFDTPGTFTYVCAVHANMTGAVTVTAATTPATPGTPAPTTPATPAPTTPAADTTAPRVTRLVATRTLRRATVAFRLAEDARVTARLRRRGSTRTLTSVTRSLAAGTRSLTLRRSLTARARYVVALRIVDAAGNVTTRTVSFRAPRS
jgi:plastocyanin